MNDRVNSHWFTENLHPGYGQSFAIGKIIYQEKTAFQDLAIYDTPALGRVLVLDGVVQITEADEFYYHEMMTHLPILAHGDAARVLIIGGGDGGALRETLKHPGVKHATVVEIDPSVVELSRKYLPSLSANAFDDPRTNLVFADGTRYVAETDERFDVVIVDSTDPTGPSVVLFETPFYQNCHNVLRENGILIRQAGVPFFQKDEYVVAHRRLSGIFADCAVALVPVPTYTGGHMALAWASDARHCRAHPVDVIKARFQAAGIETRYYSPEIHVAAFALPAFMQRAIKAAT